MSPGFCDHLSCDADELTRSLNFMVFAKRMTLASFILVVYDYLQTLKDEKDWVWENPRLTTGKILFLLVRYFSIFQMTFLVAAMFSDDLSVDMCIAVVRLDAIGCFILILLAELTLQLRLYAMYGKSRRILWFLTTSFLATSATVCVFLIVGLPKLKVLLLQPVQGDGNHICMLPTLPSFTIYIWVAIFVHELILLMLAAWKGVQEVRACREFGHVNLLLMFLVKYSVCYFISTFAVTLAVMLFHVIGGGPYVEPADGLVSAIVSVTCQRVLLQLRKRVIKSSEIIFAPDDIRI